MGSTFCVNKNGDIIIVGGNTTITNDYLVICKKKGLITWDTIFHDYGMMPYIISLVNNEIYLSCTKLIEHSLVVIKSSNYGETWTNVYPGTLEPTGGGLFDNGSIFVDKKNDIFICLESGTLYKTDYANNKWIKVLETYGVSSCSYFTSMIEDTIENVLYISELNYLPSDRYGGVYRSVDGGNNWYHIGLTNYYCSSLLQDKDNNILVSACGHHYYGTGGIYKLDQSTMQWSTLEYVPPFIIGNMVMNNKGDIIFGINDNDCTDGGVFMLPYQQGSMIDLSYNIGYSMPIEQVEVDNEGYLYIRATYSTNKLYKSTQSSITTSVNHTTKANMIAYPNPFKDKINIKINNINFKNIEIQIVNSLAQIVYSKKHHVVNNEININASTLPIGIYICKVSSGTELISVNKIIKTK